MTHADLSTETMRPAAGTAAGAGGTGAPCPAGCGAAPAEAAALRALFEAALPQARVPHGCWALLDADGSLVTQDAHAGAFFTRYVVPALRSSPALREGVRELAASTAASPAAAASSAAAMPCEAGIVPGASLAAAAVVCRRRQTAGIVVLATRCEPFPSSADVDLLRVCGRLALDAEAVGSLARSVAPAPAAPATATREAAMLAALLSERLRLWGLEQELDSLSTQLANSYEELALIDRVSGGMRVNRRTGDFFRQACLETIPVVNVRALGYALQHERVREEPRLFGEVELPPAELTALAEQLAEALRERRSSSSAVVVNDLAADPRFAWLSGVARQVLAVPLVRRDQPLGCLFALDKREGDFNSVDAKLLSSIASESAIYLENAMLFGDVHGLMMGLLHSLTSAVDAKDAYTCGHSERVALLARHLASRLGLSDAEVERVYMAGLLHDVGKIGVPESVLQKTGRLTPEEFEQIKKHPRIGARILADVRQLEDIVPGVLYHHERYDGRGYPDGLAGKEIPLMGRIICLADCFDAMTSSRTYRRALPLEVALLEIRRCSGTQFDPALADEFLRVQPQQLASLLRDHARQAKRLLDLQETLRAA